MRYRSTETKASRALPGIVACLLLSGCVLSCKHAAPVTPPTPAPAPQTSRGLVVLLPEPDGKTGGIVFTTPAGRQELSQRYQAVRIPTTGVAPDAPFPMDPAEVQRIFGALIDALPAPEASFVLYFNEGSENLTAESTAQLPLVLKTIRDRHSTLISIIGHTDTTGNPASNYELGLRRARVVAALIRRQGATDADIFTESHGEADLLVKTGRGVAESRNRRVEVVVR